MCNRQTTRRRLLSGLSVGLTLTIAGCSSDGTVSADGTNSADGTDSGGNDVQDSDGDGVIDSEDYAPRDPDVQQEGDTNTETEDESTPTPGCFDAIRITSEFEDFPEGGTYPEGEEPTEATLQISFENTIDVPVDYSISATFIEFSTSQGRDAGTISGRLDSGEAQSHEFVYEGTPQTVVEIDNYELEIESEC